MWRDILVRRRCHSCEQATAGMIFLKSHKVSETPSSSRVKVRTLSVSLVTNWSVIHAHSTALKQTSVKVSMHQHACITRAELCFDLYLLYWSVATSCWILHILRMVFPLTALHKLYWASVFMTTSTQTTYPWRPSERKKGKKLLHLRGIRCCFLNKQTKSIKWGVETTKVSLW